MENIFGLIDNQTGFIFAIGTKERCIKTKNSFDKSDCSTLYQGYEDIAKHSLYETTHNLKKFLFC